MSRLSHFLEKPFNRFVFWFLLGLITSLIGTCNVFADTYELTNLEIQGFNNNGSSLTTPSEFDCSGGSCGMYITTNANSYGGAWIIESPIALLANYTYTVSLRVRSSVSDNIVLSSKNNIAVGTSLSNAKSRYESSNFYATMNYSKAIGDYTVQFAFTPTSSGSYLVIPFTTSTTTSANYMIDYIIMDNMGNNGVTQSEINTSLNNQTNQLNQSITNSTNAITGSIAGAENNITNAITGSVGSAQDNINSNIDNLEENINDTFNTCTPGKNLFNKNAVTSNKYYTADLVLTSADNTNLSDYISVTSGQTYTFSFSATSYSIMRINYFNSSKQIVSQSTYNTISGGNGHTITIPSNISYIRFSYNTSSINSNTIQFEKGSSVTSYQEYGEVCQNKIDETNDKLDDINGSITDSNISGSENVGSSFFENFETNDYGLSDIITMPLQLINTLTNNTCVSLKLTLPFVDIPFELPCMSSIYSNYFGNFYTLYQNITFGFVSYWVIVRIFNLVKDFKNPDHDEIEVMDL